MNKLLIAFLLVSQLAFAADNVIGDKTSGTNQLVDNNGIRWNLGVAYTTDGSGDIYTLGGEIAAGDSFIGDNTSGNHLLVDNNNRRWSLNVWYTTDGNGNVIPISGGGGGGGGGVSAVTATAPLSSTGGATPAISIAKSNATTAGYLSAADWANFNGKLTGASSSTTSGIATFTNSAGNAVQSTPTTVDGTGNIVSPGSAVFASSVSAKGGLFSYDPSDSTTYWYLHNGGGQSTLQLVDSGNAFAFFGYNRGAARTFFIDYLQQQGFVFYSNGIAFGASGPLTSGYSGNAFYVEASNNKVYTGSGVDLISGAKVKIGTFLNLPQQPSGTTPTCNTAGDISLTHLFVMCVCNGSSWVKTSDGSTACTF